MVVLLLKNRYAMDRDRQLVYCLLRDLWNLARPTYRENLRRILYDWPSTSLSNERPNIARDWLGVIATWWVGAILGVPLAMVSRLGTAPKKSTAQLFRPIVMLMSLSASFALVMGMAGFIAARNGWVFIIGDLATRVPPEKHVAFITDLWAHSASYFAGFVGGIILMVHTWRSRRLNAVPTKAEPSVGHEVAGNAF